MSLALIGGIIQTVGQVADSLVTSDEERARLEIDGYNAETQRLVLQTEVNKAEAQHASLFVAGWRPAVGWVCVAALAYQFVLYPFLTWGWSAMQATGWISIGLMPPPLLDVEALMVLITGMLGIAGMRSWDKRRESAK